MNRKVRIGIDVGGTFTDAIIIDNETGAVIAKEKTPTTHQHGNGVAEGIVTLLNQLLAKYTSAPSDVIFIAHGTTQATNALLEGDVAKVGVIGIGDSNMAKRELTIENIQLASNKYLEVVNHYLTTDQIEEEQVNQAIDSLLDKGAEVIVVSEAYSVDDPTREKFVESLCKQRQIYVTSGHEISQLYGLKVRTRTAVVNASLIPKMMETANMTEKVVKEIGITSELMIMRADGGVMSINEVRKRPILTMLSGLAAGVAGALIHEKVTEGLFFEVGGTSIDISVIKDGKVMIKNAQVGGHKTYLRSLDVRTLAVAGGSMVRVKNQKIHDIGPRSAHLAEKEYECFATDRERGNPTIHTITPLRGDPDDYLTVKYDSGEEYAYTLAGAANFLGYVEPADYAYGNQETNGKAWELLGQYCGKSATEVAKEVIDIACEKIWTVIKPMIEEYEIQNDFAIFVGGGGSAAVITRALAEKYLFKHKIARNAPYISTIGVALAMLREEIEKSVINPTNDDIRQLRAEIFSKIVEAGAKEESVEVQIQIDKQKNTISAIATGATEFKAKDFGNVHLSKTELIEKIGYSVNLEPSNLREVVIVGKWHVYEGEKQTKRLFGFVKSTTKIVAVSDNQGVVVLRKPNARTYPTIVANSRQMIKEAVEEMATYSDAGQSIPRIYLFSNGRMYDYSGLMTLEQLIPVVEMDLEFVPAEESLVLVAVEK